MERMKGFYLKVGDKTSCGGYITSSSSTIFVAGKAVTRMGDKYTCGEDGKTYSIEGAYPVFLRRGYWLQEQVIVKEHVNVSVSLYP
jgi:hypothetical protein